MRYLVSIGLYLVCYTILILAVRHPIGIIASCLLGVLTGILSVPLCVFFYIK